MNMRLKSISTTSIKKIFLSEIVPAIEHLHNNSFFADGYHATQEIHFIEEKIINSPNLDFLPETIGKSHSHSIYEMCFGITGRCVIKINSKHFPFKAGDVCVFAPGVKHYEICTAEMVPYRLMWASVIPCQVRFWMSEFSKDHFGVPGGLDVEANVKYLIDEIVKEVHGKRYGFFAIVKANFIKFCVEIARQTEKQYSRTKKDTFDWRDKIISEAENYVRKNIDRKLTLAGVAQVLRLSPNYFCTLFSEGTGFSFKDYTNKVRIEKAKRLLRDSRFSIKEIAELSGFEDPAYFTRVFTNLAGKPPSEFRTGK